MAEQLQITMIRRIARALIGGAQSEHATFPLVLSLRRVLLLSGRESDRVLADGLLRLSIQMKPTAAVRMAAAVSV